MLFDKKTVPEPFLRFLPILLNGGVLFEDVPVYGERISDSGYPVMSELILCPSNQLTIIQLQAIIYRYCTYIENPQGDFRGVKNAVITLTRLIPTIQVYYSSQKDLVCMYSLIIRISLTSELISYF